MTRFTRAALLCVALGSAGPALARQPPAPDPPQVPSTLKQRLIERMKEPDQGGGLHLTKHFAIALGGIKQGSSFALGPALSTKFENGSYAQVKAVYSLNQFRLLQARYDTRRFWGDRAIALNRVRWQDAPELSLYRLGMDSPNARVDFGERKTEVSTQLSVKLAGGLRAAAGFGVERFATSEGRIDLVERDALPVVPVVAGLGAHPWFTHTMFALALDSRASPDYSRTGRLIGGAFHDYRDVHDGLDSFELYEAGGQQLVPVYDGRGVVDLSARTWLAQSTGPRSVPFFLMPTLGGGEFLRAFPNYRFRDRDAWYLKAEYRWAVREGVDVAGLYEGGKVGATIDDLGFAGMAHSYGAGIRVHSKTSDLFRLDLAHGREGFGVRIGFSAGGS